MAAALLCTLPAAASEGALLEVERSEAASDCPDSAALASAVEDNVGRKVFEPDGTDAETRIRVEFARGDGYTAELRASGEVVGTRTFVEEAESCDGLAQALTVALTIIVEDGVFPEPKPEPADVDLGEERAKPPPAPPPNVDRVEPPPPRPVVPRGVRSAEVDIGAAAHVGLLENPGAALHADARVFVSRRLSLSAGVLWLPPQTFDVEPGTVELAVVAGAMRGCATLLGEASPPRADACLLATAGALRGSTDGFTRSSSSTRFWSTVGAELAIGGRLAGPLEWSARAAVLVLTLEEGFSVAGVGTVYEPSTVGGLAGLGIRLPIE